MRCSVYRVQDVEGRYYIGSSVKCTPNSSYVGSGNWPRQMVSEGRRRELLDRREILAEFNSIEEAREYEIELQRQCIDDPMCMNLKLGGGSDLHTTERKDKMAAASKKLWSEKRDVMMQAVEKSNADPAVRYAKGSAFRGKKRPEHSAKMKVVMKGKKRTAEHCQNISKAKSGVLNLKRRRPIVINGIHYPDAYFASEIYNVPFGKLQDWARQGGRSGKPRKYHNIKLCVYA